MILQKLYECAEAIVGLENMPPPMYESKPVRWLVDLPASSQPIRESLGETKRGLPRVVPVPGPRSGKVIRPCLLADTPAYVFGAQIPDKDGHFDLRAPAKHAKFKEIVRQCFEQTGDEGVGAVVRYLDEGGFQLPSGMAVSDIITFRYNDRLLVDAPAVRSFWAKSARQTADGSEFECLVTGQRGPVDESLSQAIRGLPNGQSSGVALVSANNAAFESYGLKRAQTAPMNRDVAERVVKALNRLIARGSSRVIVGNVVYVFWTREGPDDRIGLMLREPDEQQVHDLISSTYTGKRADLSDESLEAFYAFALSANASRVVVRDMIETTLPAVNAHLARWFTAQELRLAETERYLSVGQLAAAVFRDPRKEMYAAVPQALVRTALNGDPLPVALLGKTLRRCYAERRVTRRQAVLLNMWLSTRKDRSWNMAKIEELDKQPAPYVCGQVLALLDQIQYEALGPVNSRVGERFFSGAAASPRRVLGGLLVERAIKAHLPKIRKKKPRAGVALEKRLQALLAQLSAENFPSHLSLEDQAIFMLGYYHFKANAMEQAAAKKIEKKENEL